MKTFKQIITEGVNDPSIFKAVFLAGGPGSGKSFTGRKVALESMGFKVINSDVFFEILMDKNKLSKLMPDDEFDVREPLRMKAKELSDKKLALAIEGRLGVLIDGTGKDFDSIKIAKQNLETFGYDTSMVLVNVANSTSKQRNIERGQRGGREVPEPVRSDSWKAVQRNIGKFQLLFKPRFWVVDNNAESDIESQTLNVFKKLQQWAKVKPKNTKAKKWIESQRKKV